MVFRDALGRAGAAVALSALRRCSSTGRRAAAAVGPRHPRAPVPGSPLLWRGARKARRRGAPLPVPALRAYLHGGAPRCVSGSRLPHHHDCLGACLLDLVCRQAVGRRRQTPTQPHPKLTSSACPPRLGAAKTLGQSRRSGRRSRPQAQSRAPRRHLYGPKSSVDSPFLCVQARIFGGDEAA